MATPPYPDIIPYQLRLMHPEEIAAEKIRAILTRNSARDLFDLYFLIHLKTKIKIELADKKLEYCGLKFGHEKFESKIKKMKNIWKTEITALTTSGLEYDTAAKSVLEAIKLALFHE